MATVIEPEPKVKVENTDHYLDVRLSKDGGGTEWSFHFETDDERAEALADIEGAMMEGTLIHLQGVTLRGDLIVSVNKRNRARSYYL